MDYHTKGRDAEDIQTALKLVTTKF